MPRELKKLELFLTEDCNLRCDYCYISKRKSDMSWEIAQKTLDVFYSNYSPNYTYNIEFFGGEPLLKLDLIKTIIAYVAEIEKKYNFKTVYRIVTNGLLINDEFIQLLKENPAIYLSISCDGCQEAQDQHRKTAAGQPSFALLEKKLQLLAEKWDLYRKVELHSVITPENVQYLHQSYQYFQNYAERIFQFKYNFSQVSNWQENDFIKYEKQIELIIGEEKENLLQKCKCRDEVIFNFIKNLYIEYCPSSLCQAGRQECLTVNSQGNIVLCHRFESLTRDPRFEKQKKDFMLGNIQDSAKLDWGYWQKQKATLAELMQNNAYAECSNCINKKYCFWGKCVWNNYFLNQDFSMLNTNICKTLDHFLRPVLPFYQWLQENNLIDQYLAGFGYIKPSIKI